MQHKRKVVLSLVGLVSLAWGSGCALDAGLPEETTNETSQEVFDGTPATSQKFEAVGAIVVERTFDPGDAPPIQYFDLVCSATLIDNDAVLTARHCTQKLASEQAAGNPPFFLLGETSYEPQQVLPIEGWVEADASPHHPGLLFDGGRDIAVAYLGGCPKGVKPAKIGEFRAKDVGDQFGIVGFGYNDLYLEEYGFLDLGTKVEGTVTARALSGQWYKLLFNGDYDAYLSWYLADAVTATPSEEEAAAWWDAYTLEPGYELLAGGLEDESLGCFGDSGGPLYDLHKHSLTVVGVNFATESSQADLCTKGGAYAVLNKEMKKFVDRAISGKKRKR